MKKKIEIELEAYADRLVEDYNINKKRILKILTNSLRDDEYFYKEYNTVKQKKKNETFEINEYSFHPNIRRALQYLPKEHALNLFENSDLVKLDKYEYIFSNLVHFSRSIGNLLPLDYLPNESRLHMLKNKETIINAGYPKYSFNQLGLLKHFLSVIYPVKKPFAIGVQKLFPHIFEFNYIWASAYKDGTPLPPLDTKKDNRSFKIISYNDAARCDLYSEEVSTRLDRDRSKIYQMKSDVLNQLYKSINDVNHTNLFNNCLKIFTRDLSAEDLEFYGSLDEKILFSFVTDPIFISEEVNFSLSHHTFDNLFKLIGFFEYEIENQIISTILKKLEKILVYNPITKKPFIPYDSYYQAISIHGNSIDQVLDWCNTNIEKLPRISKSFMDKVNDAFEYEFFKNININIKIKKGMAEKFESHLTSYANWSKTHLDLTGNFPLLKISQEYPELKNTDSFISFQHSPDYRWVRLRDIEFILTPREASVVQLLHENHPRYISKDYIITELFGSESNIVRLRDIFSHRDAYKELIKSKSRSGLYTLNI